MGWQRAVEAMIRWTVYFVLTRTVALVAVEAKAVVSGHVVFEARPVTRCLTH